jgi:hypothetical protein
MLSGGPGYPGAGVMGPMGWWWFPWAWARLLPIPPPPLPCCGYGEVRQSPAARPPYPPSAWEPRINNIRERDLNSFLIYTHGILTQSTIGPSTINPMLFMYTCTKETGTDKSPLPQLTLLYYWLLCICYGFFLCASACAHIYAYPRLYTFPSIIYSHLLQRQQESCTNTNTK